MTIEGQVGDQHWRARGEGAGFSGITLAEKDKACGRDSRDRTAGDRLASAAANSQLVMRAHGSGYWRRRDPREARYWTTEAPK